jgi:hypothetical protein
VIIEWVSAGFAGFFAGRLRTRLTGYHSDEVFFRDTAHGFIAWSFSLVILAAVFASSLAGILGKATDATASVASGAASGAAQSTGVGDYFTDRLFRTAAHGGSATAAAPAATTGAATTTDTATTGAATTGAATTATTTPDATGAAPTAAAPAAAPAPAPMAEPPAAPTATGMAATTAGMPGTTDATRAEAGRIIAQSLAAGQISADDRTYLAQLVASNTGIAQADAEARIDAAINDAKSAADAARSTAAKASLFLAISLLVGAFIACVAAGLGGRERDEDEVRLGRVT